MTKEKMTAYFSGKIKGNRQELIAPAVAAALESFCEQEPEFEQAIEQSGKSFQECLDSVTKGCGNCLSDLEAYQKAVQFYFSTATVSFHMTIDLSGGKDFTNCYECLSKYLNEEERTHGCLKKKNNG